MKSDQNRYGRYADRRKFPAAHRRVVKEHGAVPGTSDKLAAKVVGTRASIAITAIQLTNFMRKTRGKCILGCMIQLLAWMASVNRTRDDTGQYAKDAKGNQGLGVAYPVCDP